MAVGRWLWVLVVTVFVGALLLAGCGGSQSGDEARETRRQKALSQQEEMKAIGQNKMAAAGESKKAGGE